jgi:AmmeMemoRadiSam system protein B/AmmeMemoRadiSam system protein A
MKINKLTILVLTICVLLSTSAYAADRFPSARGFYPSDSAALYSMVDTMMDNSKPVVIDGSPLALISPHAGFVYSGPTAAEAYNLLKNTPDIKTAIIIGFKHQVNYKGIAVWPEGSWQTPLGNVAVDSELAGEIIKSANYITTEESIFFGEHSLEVQLPFLQVAVPDIRIVPIQLGFVDDQMIFRFVKDLTAVLKNKDDYILIASTDLSHYHSRSECQKLDAKTAEYIVDLDGKGLWNASRSGKAELCGAAATSVVLQVAKNLGADKVKILKMSDSGDFSGDISRVVGYLSAVIYKSGAKSKTQKPPKKESGYLSEEEHEILLNIARQSIEAYINGKPLPSFDVPEGKLTNDGAAFVTINKNHQLRGCIGYTEAIMPLYQTVSTCAIKAASEDPRFPKLTKMEYPDIDLEISVLTPLEKIIDVNKIEVGKHGLMLRKGYYRGLLLPQVATSYGWDRVTFLDQTCRKAGMPAGCWKDNCDIYIFSAEVFGEE